MPLFLSLLLACGQRPPPTPATTVDPGQGLCPPDAPKSGCEWVCDDGVDDDGDGLVDCEDPACFRVEGCTELACLDGQDDDGDGLVDCADEDCWIFDDPDADCLPILAVFDGADRIVRNVSLVGTGTVDVCEPDALSNHVVIVEGPRGHVEIGPPEAVAQVCSFERVHSVFHPSSTDGPWERSVGLVTVADPRCSFLPELRTDLVDVFVDDGASIEISQRGRRLWWAPRASASTWGSTSWTPTTQDSECRSGYAGYYAPIEPGSAELF